MPTILTRAQWGALPGSVGKFGKMPGPVSKIWAHHSVTPSNVTPKVAAKTLENIGMTRFGVFSYTFAIHPDGTIIEGCGWDFRGAHTAGQNSMSYGFVFVGNYVTETLSKAQIESFRWLVADGKKRGRISSAAVIDGHQRASGAATACPGGNVMAKLPELRKPLPTRNTFKVTATKTRKITGGKKARAWAMTMRLRGFNTRIKEL
jgi:hypothetical protein